MLDKFKVIIVDDENQARKGVALLLEKDELCEIVSVCKNGIEAIDDIKKFKPDLVFLDIQMPEVDGLEVVNSIDIENMPAIIFTTAYDEFALQAFELHAIDYLLKPFTDERFFASLEHAKRIILNSQLKKFKSRISFLMQDFHENENKRSPSGYIINERQGNDEKVVSRITIKSDKKIHFIQIDDITHLEGFDAYVKIHLKGKIFIIKESLKSLKLRLNNYKFERVHKSFIVNMNYVEILEPYKSGDFYLMLTTGIRLRGSRNFRKNLERYT